MFNIGSVMIVFRTILLFSFVGLGYGSPLLDNLSSESSLIKNTYQIPTNMKFNPVSDADITDIDPRIKSIIYSSKSDTRSKVSILYSDQDSSVLAFDIAKILVKHNLQVLKPNMITNKVSSDVIVSVIY